MLKLKVKYNDPTWSAYVDDGVLFPPDISDDSRVLYHGTSSECAGAIERDGLQWTERVCSYHEIVDLVAVYYALGWRPQVTGGISTLAGFSYGDFCGSTAKPVFLAETAWRASNYARRAVAGGESVQAIRIAIEDLSRYLQDRDIRDCHARGPAEDVFPGRPDWPEVVSRAKWGEMHTRADGDRRQWVERQLRRLEPLRARCLGPLQRYEHGIVYAVRVLPQDDLLLGVSGSSGVRWHGRIPPDRLAARADLPQDFESSVDRRAPPATENERRSFAVDVWRQRVLKQRDSAMPEPPETT